MSVLPSDPDVFECPTSWLCAARLITVTIGLPLASRACSRPTFGSIAVGLPWLSVVGKLVDSGGGGFAGGVYGPRGGGGAGRGWGAPPAACAPCLSSPSM